MNIIPTPQIVTEIAARGVYLMQNYLYWKQEVDATGDRDSKVQLDKWETRMHEYLKGIGATEWKNLKTLIEELTVKNNQ